MSETAIVDPPVAAPAPEAPPAPADTLEARLLEAGSRVKAERPAHFPAALQLAAAPAVAEAWAALLAPVPVEPELARAEGRSYLRVVGAWYVLIGPPEMALSPGPAPLVVDLAYGGPTNHGGGAAAGSVAGFAAAVARSLEDLAVAARRVRGLVATGPAQLTVQAGRRGLRLAVYVDVAAVR
jgi:hypothetical protein